MKPLYDRVLVERIKDGNNMVGSLYIPEVSKQKPQQAVVIAVGSGRIDSNGKTVPMSVSVGDRVIFGKYDGTEIKIDGKEYLMFREGDILGVIE